MDLCFIIGIYLKVTSVGQCYLAPKVSFKKEKNFKKNGDLIYRMSDQITSIKIIWN